MEGFIGRITCLYFSRNGLWTWRAQTKWVDSFPFLVKTSWVLRAHRRTDYNVKNLFHDERERLGRQYCNITNIILCILHFQQTTCVALGASTVTILSGFWYARNCHEKHPFLCKTPLLKKYQPPTKLKCHYSYTLYKDGKTCYRRLNEPTTFEDGKKLCEADQQKLNLNTRPTLLTIDSVFEMSFFRSWMLMSGAPYDRSVWVGLKLKKDKVRSRVCPFFFNQSLLLFWSNAST